MQGLSYKSPCEKDEKNIIKKESMKAENVEKYFLKLYYLNPGKIVFSAVDGGSIEKNRASVAAHCVSDTGSSLF